jgi:hypothetical protein
MSLELKLVLPVMAPLSHDEDQLQLQDEALAELQQLEPISPLDAMFGEARLRTRVISDPSREPGMAELWKEPPGLRKYRFLVLETNGDECADGIFLTSQVSASAHFTSDQMVGLSQRGALLCLQLESNTLLLISNVLRPGSLSTIEGFCFVGGEYATRTTPFFAEPLFRAVEAAERLGWPVFSRPSLLQAWTWLRTSGALVDGIGVGRLGRALSAVSHLTSSTLTESSSIDLVWLLLGLEALYSKGNVGLKEQLLGKSEALLGPRLENKKAFGLVYDFRSRLLHGDVDLPLRFTEYNAVKKYEDFWEELTKNEDVALAVLLATLQWMATNSVTELNFEYALSSFGKAAN